MRCLLLLSVSLSGIGLTTGFSPLQSRSCATTYLAAAEGQQRKRRVRRKVPPPSDETPEISPADVVKPRPEAVTMKVQDIRDLVNGRPESSSPTPEPVVPTTATSATAETTSAATTSPVGSNSTSGGSLDDSLQQLLLDAKSMQDSSTSKADDDESDVGISSQVRNVISTIVTIDFFVVCLFLLWFLAGIFCSSILKDDTVQIAFNSNFQQLVQPALGILMIAAISDAVAKKDDENESSKD